MRKDFMLCLGALACCTLLGLWNTEYWWGFARNRSDWSGVPCDYATNKPVHDYYTGQEAGWYRTTVFDRVAPMGDDWAMPEEVLRRVVVGDTVTVGVDYYAAYPLSGRLLPPTARHAGPVRRYAVYLCEEGVRWELVEP